jgi:hypothetical protein
VRASGPKAVRPYQCCSAPPASGTIPGPGFSPTTPQQAAGIRIEPPPSEPSASAAIPAASAAAPPPVEPPGVLLVSQGFLVAVNAAGSVNGQIANSGIWVLPITTHPAARSRRTSSSSRSAGSARVAADPARVGTPATSTLSLTATGTPASGSVARSGRPARACASAMACSASTTWNAWIPGSSRVIWLRWAWTTSAGLTLASRTARAISRAGQVGISLIADSLHHGELTT